MGSQWEVIRRKRQEAEGWKWTCKKEDGEKMSGRWEGWKEERMGKKERREEGWRKIFVFCKNKFKEDNKSQGDKWQQFSAR